MIRNLKSVAELSDATPFSEAQIRWWLACADRNGLTEAQAVVRVGQRRIYIDTDAFDRWLTKQQEQRTPA